MGTIWLIVEDKDDADVVRAILKARDVSVRIEPLPPSVQTGGIYRLLDQLEELIQVAYKRRRQNDCVAVLHDSDKHRQPDRTVYDRIEAICKKHRVKLVVAEDEIESWLLADGGVSRWLGITPKRWDTQPKPKDTLRGLVQQKRQPLKYQGPGRDKVLKQIDGTGDKYSPSLRGALALLEDAPCTKS